MEYQSDLYYQEYDCLEHYWMVYTLSITHITRWRWSEGMIYFVFNCQFYIRNINLLLLSVLGIYPGIFKNWSDIPYEEERLVVSCKVTNENSYIISQWNKIITHHSYLQRLYFMCAWYMLSKSNKLDKYFSWINHPFAQILLIKTYCTSLPNLSLIHIWRCRRIER